MTGPLEGIRVLEWAAFHNGPAAGYMLGDLGAEVIKIEEPVRGDPTRGMTYMYGDSITLPGGKLVWFELANRNKKGIAVDLSTDEGKKIIYQLVEKSDVFLTNYYRNNLLIRKGMDYETLSKYNPRLIYAVSSAYGLQGPRSNQRGFDTSIQAQSGLMWMMGDRECREPVQVVGAPCDQMGATMLAYAILGALLARERLGIAQKVEVSMLGSAIHLQAVGLNFTLLRGKHNSRHSRKKARNPLANHYCCGDGKWIMLAEPQVERFWPQFCRSTGLDHLLKDHRFQNVHESLHEYSEELIKALDGAFATRTRDEWLTRFETMRVEFAYSPILDYDELIKDPQVAKNRLLVDFDHPALGKVKMVNCPIDFSKTPAGPYREAPELGQHTEEVLLNLLGYSWDEIATLKEKGAIG